MRAPRAGCIALLLLAGAVLTACPGPGHPGDTATPGDVLGDIRASALADVPTVVQVEWTSGIPGEGWVEYGLGSVEERRSPATAPGTTAHRVRLFPLKAGHDYLYRVVLRDRHGQDHASETLVFRVPPPPEDLPRLELVRHDPLLAGSEGYLLTTQIAIDASWVVLLDRDGDYAWYRRVGPGLVVLTARPSRDGGGVSYNQSDVNQQVDVGAVTTVPFTGGPEDRTCTLQGHHDFVELPDGRVGFLSLDLRWAEVDGEEHYVAGDAILEVPAGSTACDDAEEVFSLFDLFPEGELPLTQDFYGPPVAGGRDWSHANSLVHDEEAGAYYLLARNLDALVKVDRSSGEPLWQLGGDHSDFAFPDPRHRWSHGHVSQVWDGGMVLFDNGIHRDPPWSRVAEYRWDEDALTVTLAWEHWEPGGGFTEFSGDARVLPGGNVLISWGGLGRISEVTPGGQVAWELESQLGAAIGRVHWIEESDLSP